MVTDAPIADQTELTSKILASKGLARQLFPAIDWLDTISRFWPHLVAGFDVLAALLASIHVLLHKRDSRAATLWLGTFWFLPMLGPILYLALGVNRIRRRAISLGVHKTNIHPVPEPLGESQPSGVGHLECWRASSVVSSSNP